MLKPKTYRPYKVFLETDDTVNTREDRIPNNFSIDLTTRVPKGNEDSKPDENHGKESKPLSTKDTVRDVYLNATEDTENPNEGEAEAT